MRVTLTREFYITGATELHNDGYLSAYLKPGEKPVLITFKGKSNKPVVNGWFRTADALYTYYTKWLEAAQAQKVAADARALERKVEKAAFKHDFEIGDILYSSWGYEQTNVDFYQVVGKTDKTITVREIAKEYKELGWLRSNSKARKDAFVGEPFRRTVKYCNGGKGTIDIESYSGAWEWDGSEKYESRYA
jgi:hypothetical protein